MQDLIERMEKATGPDRELDAAIAVHAHTPSCGIVKGADIGTVLTAHDCNVVDLPAYTASIDAALTLVPEGLIVSIVRYAEGDANADVRGPTVAEAVWDAPSPAIALCIAALKARAATDSRITSGADQPGTAAIVPNQQDDGSKG